MRKVGDTEKSGGIVTTITNIDPETGQITWDVDYDADYLKLFKDITDAFNTAKQVAQSSQEPFFQEYYNELRELRNQLRTYLRKNKAEEYERIKGMNEMMTTGGSANFTANVGTGAQYATPFAFNKNKKAKGTASNYYYKLGYKPVDKKKLRKQAKGIEVKQLFEK
jgi:hypothetical protein